VYGPDGFFQMLDVDKRTGVLEVTIQSERPIGRTFVRRLPQFLTQVMIPSYALDDKLLWELCISPKRRASTYAQPSVDRSGHNVSWTVVSPKLWSRFLLVCAYKGEEEKVDAWQRQRRLTFTEAVYVASMRFLSS
jgi:hypothetical protein